MVWGGDIVATSQQSSRSNVDLEIGCLIDLAMGMLSFSANGRELGTCYQVGTASGAETAMSPYYLPVPHSLYIRHPHHGVGR